MDFIIVDTEAEKDRYNDVLPVTCDEALDIYARKYAKYGFTKSRLQEMVIKDSALPKSLLYTMLGWVLEKHYGNDDI